MESNELTEQLERLKNGFDARMDKQIEPIKDAMAKNQTALDNLLARSNERPMSFGKKTFGDAFSYEVHNQFSQKHPG